MKALAKSILQLAVIGTMILTSAQGSFAQGAQPQDKEVVVGINDAFIPGGFDSTSDAYTVVSGLFPNGCYHWKGGEVTNMDTFNHEVRAIATVSQGMCPMVLIPFTKEIRLGRLASGTHTLKFMSGDGTYLQKILTIE